jgi:hypothetical protein
MATKSKGKGGVNPRSWKKHMGRRRPHDDGSQANRRVRRTGKKIIRESIEENLTEKTHILQFINSITRKNYAQANKYLSMIVEDKIRTKINSSLNQPLF